MGSIAIALEKPFLNPLSARAGKMAWAKRTGARRRYQAAGEGR